MFYTACCGVVFFTQILFIYQYLKVHTAAIMSIIACAIIIGVSLPIFIYDIISPITNGKNDKNRQETYRQSIIKGKKLCCRAQKKAINKITFVFPYLFNNLGKL